MLKHATISRTSKAQQTLQLQRQWSASSQHQHQQLELQRQTDSSQGKDVIDGQFSEQFPPTSPTTTTHSALFSQQHQFVSSSTSNCIELNNNSPFYPHVSMQTPSPLPSCNSSPTPSILSTPNKVHNFLNNNTTIRSLPASPIKSRSGLAQKKCCASESMIKVFAQTLSQDVEYVTLHVNTQTKSSQVVKSLLKKFRLKHRDPKLFYLTLERWIRHEGLKAKSVMLLADEACPLQLQQCCSNPPHNDIKFTLRTKAGALVKIFCSDVVPDARYKCLSLSTETTVEETIELMLHCLNLVQANNTDACHQHIRLSNSPSSTGSSSSSSNSSSSGIESDQPNSGCLNTDSSHLTDRLNSDSRASSVTSISSASNISTISASTIDQYCMVIECVDTNYKRILEPNEYLVGVYQNLLAEAKGQTAANSLEVPKTSTDLTNQQPEQWFFIKLKRRNDSSNNQTIKFTSPRQNLPLPPIPSLVSQFNTAANLHNIVSTTQIEVKHRPGSSNIPSYTSGQFHIPPNQEHAIDQTTRMQPPPPQIITLQPLVRPRRRNLSNASSTFSSSVTNQSKRRYDPAQLVEDLNKLDTKEVDHDQSTTSLLVLSTDETHNLTDSPSDQLELASSKGTQEHQLPQTSPDSALN